MLTRQVNRGSAIANTPQRLPAAERREQLISAFVAEALAQGSIGSVGVRAVLERAGCSAPVLYRLFGDRRGLLEAAVRRTHHPMFERLDAVCDDLERGALERLREVAYGSLRRPRGEGEDFQALLIAECPRDRQLARSTRRVYARFEERLVKLLQQGVESGELRSDLDPHYRAWRLIDLGLFRDQAWMMRLERPEKLDYLPRALESLFEEMLP